MGNQTLWSFYTQQAQWQMERGLAGIESADDWLRQRDELYRQFMVSVGLWPLPERCALDVREHGTFRGPGYRATRLSWRMLSDCRATGHLYLPDVPPGSRLPAILYTCGHAEIGVLHYQYHAAAWARRGYACLILDTVEQHDNPGDHHGLWFGNRADWLSLGYSAAGGELWNSMRALDVLASQEQVDPARLGVTGISGGGAASFFLAVADQRIAMVASAAGVSSFAWALKDRFLLYHCDCMYPHNPFGRDIAEFAGLIAPRPLLLTFSRHDPLYCPEEFGSLAARTRKVYELLGKSENCSLFVYDGPHAYRPETIETIQRWADRHLGMEGAPILTETEAEHPEPVTSVFNGLPPAPDRLNLLAELLSPRGGLPLPASPQEWHKTRSAALTGIKRDILMRVQDDRTFCLEPGGHWMWANGGFSRMWRMDCDGMEVPATLTTPGPEYDRVLVCIAGADENMRALQDRIPPVLDGRTAILAVEPRVGGLAGAHPSHQRDLLRAGALVGLTPTMMMIQDLWRLMPRLYDDVDELRNKKVFAYGRGDAGVACLYHALFDERMAGVLLEAPPPSHRDGGHILGILRQMDLPQAVGLMAPRPVGVVWPPRSNTRSWHWVARLHERLDIRHAMVGGQSLCTVAQRVFAYGQ